MTLSFVTGGNIEIAPFKLQQLTELKLIQKINEHTRLYFTGILAEGCQDQPVRDTSGETKIELSQVDFHSAKTLLFTGIVSRMEVKAVRDVYAIEVEAVSYTQLMDVKLKNRSFQNPNLTNEALVKQVVNEYKGDIKDNVSQGEKTGKVIIQYQETDWQLLKRLASRFYTGLIPHPLSNKPKLFFGLPEPDDKTPKLENFHYRVCKKLGEYRFAAENSIPGITADDFVYYEVESEQPLNLGTKVNFQDTPLYVCEATTFLENDIIKHHYLMAPEKGLSQIKLYNEALVGISLEGRVIDVAKDNVRIHLDIDSKQKKEEAFWFPYSSVYTAEGNSGWYCMPELDDYVRLYFPTKKEEEAVAVSSVRKDANDSKHNKISNPDIKYFRTKSGKELMFSPSEIVITGKDDQIFLKLNDKDGITIYSQKAVNIIAKQDLTLESEEAKVIIKAKDGVEISCDSSEVKLDKTSIVIKGDQIKTN